MANPQLENGYIRLATEIFEALCRIRISGEARQVIDTVIRKTYGYHKKEDDISLSQFCLSTGMSRSIVCRAINKAVEMNIVKVISKKANGSTNRYCIVKDFDSWKPLAKKRRGVAKKQIIISKKANKGVAKKRHTIDSIKDTITKDIAVAETSSAEIVKIIDLFENLNPNFKEWYGNKTQRVAVSYLIEKYGFEKVSRMVVALPEIVRKKYAPKITSPFELKRDLAKLILFVEQEKQGKFKTALI